MNIGELVSEKRKNKGCWWQRGLNLVAGCTPVSEACLHCWSAEMAHRQSMRHGISDYQWNLWGGLTTDAGKWSGETRLLEKNLELPKTVKKPTLFSVWNDLFHPAVPDTFQYRFLETVMDCPQHFFLVLTKRPENLLKFYNQCEDYDSSTLPNLGYGVTVELPKYLHRIETLLQIPAALHFVSLEPLLGELSIKPFLTGWSGKNSGLPHRLSEELETLPDINKLDWVSMGCETGSKRRKTETKWIASIADECLNADVPFFIKKISNGENRLFHAQEYLGENARQFPEVEWKP